MANEQDDVKKGRSRDRPRTFLDLSKLRKQKIQKESDLLFEEFPPADDDAIDKESAETGK